MASMELVRFGRRPFDTLHATFRWRIPAVYNIGVDVCDKWAGEPGRVALMDVTAEDAAPYTFTELARRSNRWANALRAVGVGRGDRVAIVLSQRPEVALAHIATYKLGAVAVPLAVLFGDDALEFRLRDSGARAVVFDGLTAPKLDRIRHRLPDLQHLIAVDETARDVPGSQAAAVLEERASDGFAPAETRPDDPALIMYTSGTTGPPKGAVLPHSALIGHLPAFVLFNNLAPRAGDRLWSPADWAWIGGLFNVLWAGWHYGIPVVAFRQPKFDPERAFWVLERHGIRNAFLFPTALKLMRQAHTGGPRPGVRLRSVYSAGEPVGEELIGWGREVLGVTINEFFGQTEMNLVAGNCAELLPVKPGSFGKPYPGHDVDILNEEGHPVPPGTLGEVAVRRPDPVMFLGYWNNPEGTQRKFVGDWAMMGDLAVKDEDGYLWFKARKDDMIKSGAYRIGPGEVEECLLRHPAVAMAAVVGVPDPDRGQAIKAYIRLASSAPPPSGLAGELQQLVRDRVGLHAYPRSIEFVDELPLTTTGKLQRFVLRERAEPSPMPRQPLATGGPARVSALLFDVFGTCVDWRTGVVREGEAFGRAHGLAGVDWAKFADAWRALYQPQMENVRAGRRPWTTLDDLHRESLDVVLRDFGIDGIPAAALDELNRAWHRLDPWPDTIEGLRRLKAKYVIAPNSNGHVALILNMAKRAGIPWDAILGAEIARAYKPMPEEYLRNVEILGLHPAQVMMVAAHNADLVAARACGLRTAFVARPAEHGAGQTTDLKPDHAYDVIALDFIDLAHQMGC